MFFSWVFLVLASLVDSCDFLFWGLNMLFFSARGLTLLVDLATLGLLLPYHPRQASKHLLRSVLTLEDYLKSTQSIFAGGVWMSRVKTVKRYKAGCFECPKQPKHLFSSL